MVLDAREKEKGHMATRSRKHKHTGTGANFLSFFFFYFYFYFYPGRAIALSLTKLSTPAEIKDGTQLSLRPDGEGDPTNEKENAQCSLEEDSSSIHPCAVCDDGSL